MSKTFHDGERRIGVRGLRHEHPDLRRLARVLIEFAQAEAEAAAAAQHEVSAQKDPIDQPANREQTTPPSPSSGAGTTTLPNNQLPGEAA